ncbi:MAG: TIGR03667 family PPOX class F420-dependent oxidoreductase [Thermomicrobiales bacterium]
MFSIDTSTAFGKRITDQLAHEEVIWLTTTSADGTPYPVPVWFLWDGQAMLIYSRPNKPKLRHIESNPHAALHFNSDPEATKVGVILGTAQIDSSAPPATDIPAYVDKYRGPAARLGWTPEQFAADYPVQVRFTPEKLYGY